MDNARSVRDVDCACSDYGPSFRGWFSEGRYADGQRRSNGAGYRSGHRRRVGLSRHRDRPRPRPRRPFQKRAEAVRREQRRKCHGEQCVRSGAYFRWSVDRLAANPVRYSKPQSGGLGGKQNNADARRHCGPGPHICRTPRTRRAPRDGRAPRGGRARRPAASPGLRAPTTSVTNGSNAAPTTANGFTRKCAYA